MPLLHPGATFAEQSLTVPGRATVKVPEMFGCQFSVMLFYRGSWCSYYNAQLRAFQHASAAALAEAGVQVAALSVDDEATTTDGIQLRIEPGQAVIPDRIDHDLTTGELDR